MNGRPGRGERAGLVVIIPTTAGAIQIMGLRWSQKVPSSRVVLGNETATQCDRWTQDYNNLLRPGDPLRTLMGLPETGGYRLVVSAEIDHGRSWLMPVSAAHFGAARGETLHNDLARGRLLVWTTGAIDYSQPDTPKDAKVVENDYHLISKIDHSRELFASAGHAGTPVLCVLPQGPDAEKAATVLGKLLGQQPHHVAIAGSLADLTQPLDSFLATGGFNAPPANPNPVAIYAPPADRKASSEKTVRAAKRPAAQQAGVSAQAPEQPAKSEESPKPGQPAAPAQPPPPRPAAAVTQLDTTPRPKAEPPPVARGLAGDPAGAAPRQDRRLPIGALMGVGVVLLGIGGSYVALNGLQPSLSGQPRPPLGTQPIGGSTVTSPLSGSQSAALSAQPQSGAGLAPTPTPAPSGPAIARLTLLAAPPGSTCQAQIYQMQPRFAETVVDIAGDRPLIEIDGANLCGLAITGASFQRGTGSATVQSLSSATRIVFAQSGVIVPPALTLNGAAVSRIELKLK